MSQFITPSIDAPPPRNLTSELNSIYAADAKYAPQSAALNAQYSPVYNRTAINNLGESVQGYTDASGVYHPGSQALNTGANATNRAADLADVQRLAPAQREAYLNANPWLRRSLDQLQGRTTDSALLQQLNQQAEAGLASGGQLSPQELRQLNQESRAGFSDRGMFGGNQSLAAEVLSRDAASRSRLAAAQQFASGVQGLNANQNAFVDKATGTFASALSDPFMSILGRSGGAGANQNNNSIYKPMDLGSYAQDLYNTNYNAGVNLGIAQSNAQAQTRQAIATVASGFVGSDVKLKSGVKHIGKSPSGIPIVEFAYRNDPNGTRFRGVLAQDVEKINPAAVMSVGGIKFVDYSQIDVKFEEAA